MMHKLFLFTASLLLLACSNDDNGTNDITELQIKKFTSTSVDANRNPTGSSTEYFFAGNGTFIQKKTNNIPVGETKITDYAYNQLGQLTEAKTRFVELNGSRTLGYNYDSNNNLDKITDAFNGETPETYYQLTYEPNKINVEHQSPGFYDQLNYTNNKLTSITRLFDLGGSSTENLTYDAANNIIQNAITGFNGTADYNKNYTYEYDNKINPLYPYYNEYPLNLLSENFFSLDYSKLFFSPNNFTKEVYTDSESQNNYTITKSYQYNEDGYPVSAEVMRDGVLTILATYEYY